MVRIPRSVLDNLETGPVPIDAVPTEAVTALRTGGATIQETGDTYVLESVGETGAAVAAGLDAPFAIEYRDTVDSTNRIAREYAEDGATNLVVIADRQTGGRGRRERRWESPSGGLWLSIVVQPTISPEQLGLLTFAGAVAVVEAAADHGVETHIKWPNDVFVEAEGDRKKLAGVLTESGTTADGDQWVVIGTGVNADIPPDELPVQATSLHAHTGAVDRPRFTQELLESFHALSTDPDTILQQWRKHEGTLDHDVRIQTSDGDITGTAIDVTDTGALIVDTGGGHRTIAAGDCTRLRTK